MVSIAGRVSELRQEKGWSQRELARRSGVPHPTLNRIETGKTKGVDFDTLERLADALDVHPRDLIVREPAPPRGKRPAQ